MSDNIEPYIPICHRPPNTFIEYREEEFTTDHGGSGIVRIAVFKTKSGKICEETAQVIWRYNPISKERKEI